MSNTSASAHTLLHAGQPILKDGCCGNTETHLSRNTYDKFGHSLCKCGWLGPCQSSTSDRKNDHRQHRTAEA